MSTIWGDIFHILAIGLTEEDAREILLNVNQYLEHYNQIHTKKYTIRVNSGYALVHAGSVYNAQEIFDSAEQNLKIEKERRSVSGTACFFDTV